MDSLIVTLYNESDHWKIINSWCTSEFYIKRKEQEPSVPTVGLPYATDKAEVRPGEPIKGSDSAYAAGTLNLSLSTDKCTKKQEQGEALLEKGTNDAEGGQKELTHTDYKGKSVTLKLIDEKDRNGKPYLLTSDGKLSYGVIPGGLVPDEPKTKEVRLSLGNQDDSSINYRYGLVHILQEHFAQLEELGFDTVEAYIKHVLKNIGGAVLDKIYAGKTNHFVFTIPFSSENHPKQKRVDTIIVELHEESDHWDIINTCRSTEAYIKKKEKRGTVPSIGLSHAADKTEVFDESTTRSSGS